MKNKNLQRLLAVFLCLVMVLSLLTACSKDDDDDEDEDDEKTSQSDKQKDDKDSDKDEDKDTNKDEDKDSDKDEEKKPTKATSSAAVETEEEEEVVKPTKAPATKPTKAPTKATKPAASEPEPETSVNTDSETTAKYSGITVTKLPYTNKDLTIKSIFFDDGKVIVRVTNNTGSPIARYSSFSCKCYDKDGTLLDTSTMWLEDLNDGETAETYFYAADGTTKIIFGEAAIYEGTEIVEPSSTSVYDGITVNKLPYASNGVTFDSISFDDYSKATVRFTNNTGFPIAKISFFSYKCYDEDGIVLDSGDVYLEDLNDGETAEIWFYVEDNIDKFIFGKVSVSEGDEIVEPSTSVYDGITVNKLPYTAEGLTIDSISFDDYGTAIVRVTNGTGSPIARYSSFSYKCYDADGVILDSGNMYLENLNDGETAEVHLNPADGTTKIIFGEASVSEGTETVEPSSTAVYNGITTNKLPYTSKGITIESISVNDYGKVTLSVTNESGSAITGLSSFAYKCYNKDGIVLDSGSAFLEDLNDGETAEVYFYPATDTAKLFFFEAAINN